MERSPEPDDGEVTLAVAMARLILDPDVSLQAPPNLKFFRLGILQDSLILASNRDTGSPPVFGRFPPYLVFDSGTRTSP